MYVAPCGFQNSAPLNWRINPCEHVLYVGVDQQLVLEILQKEEAGARGDAQGHTQTGGRAGLGSNNAVGRIV